MGPKSKNIYRQNRINTHNSWQYTEVLRSKTIGLCKKPNIIVLYPLIHNIGKRSWARSQQSGARASCRTWRSKLARELMRMLYCSSNCTYLCLSWMPQPIFACAISVGKPGLYTDSQCLRSHVIMRQEVRRGCGLQVMLKIRFSFSFLRPQHIV